MKKFIIFFIVLLFLFFSFEVRKYEIYNNLKKLYSYIQNLTGEIGPTIIFAPHCDDETLGCGGIILNLISLKKNVKVVVMTNGDGFKYAAEAEFKKFSLKPQDYIKFAYERQKETIDALKILGIKESNIIFLGYPDRGLQNLWNKYFNCNTLYTSHFTKDNFSPYYNSFTKSTPYCGRSLLSDIKKIILQSKAKEIYVPHPNDDHLDHKATYCFVKLALEELEKENENSKDIKLYTYLVHRGDWPQPQGFYPDLPLVPPPQLLNIDTYWGKLDLSKERVEIKYQAFLRYKSQIRVMKRFISSFIRKNEIFGVLQDVKIEEINSLKIDGKSPDWKNINSKILDPKGDNLSKNKSLDITSVCLSKDKDNIYIMLKTAKKISSLLYLKLNFHLVSEDYPNLQIILKGKNAIINGVLRKEIIFAKADVLEIKIPKKILNNSSKFFLQIDGYLSYLKIDSTPWRLVYQ